MPYNDMFLWYYIVIWIAQVCVILFSIMEGWGYVEAFKKIKKAYKPSRWVKPILIFGMCCLVVSFGLLTLWIAGYRHKIWTAHEAKIEWYKNNPEIRKSVESKIQEMAAHRKEIDKLEEQIKQTEAAYNKEKVKVENE